MYKKKLQAMDRLQNIYKTGIYGPKKMKGWMELYTK